MRIDRDLKGHDSVNAVVALGNFDGVHQGHAAVLAALLAIAKRENLKPTVVNFAPHPRDYFAANGRGSRVPHIYSVRERLALLSDAGIERVLLLRFNAALAQLSAQDFVERLLIANCQAKVVMVGRDVRFGHQRTGDLALLQELAIRHGFRVQVLEDVVDPHALRVSSSTVRQALAAGQVQVANRLLGRDYALSGRVIHGRKLGRTLGCPTLNINLRLPLPALQGIWVVAIEGLTALPLQGVASLGLRPTVENTQRYSLEVHAFDWSGDAYGKRLSIRFLHKLRDEAAYIDLANLQVAIHQDMQNARVWLKASEI